MKFLAGFLVVALFFNASMATLSLVPAPYCICGTAMKLGIDVPSLCTFKEKFGHGFVKPWGWGGWKGGCSNFDDDDRSSSCGCGGCGCGMCKPWMC